jgi:seryl-tRNA synthetase
MLDINLIREKKEEVTKALLKKGAKVDFTGVLGLDDERRKLITESDALKAKRNEVSGLIPKLKKEGKDVSGLLEEMKGVSDAVKDLDGKLAAIKAKIKAILEQLPNIPDDDVPPGGKEHNEVIRVSGKKPEFAFKPKDHIELATSLSLIDYERGVKMGGNGFWLYKADGALLEWALLNYFVETHAADGYEFPSSRTMCFILRPKKAGASTSFSFPLLKPHSSTIIGMKSYRRMNFQRNIFPLPPVTEKRPEVTGHRSVG